MVDDNNEDEEFSDELVDYLNKTLGADRCSLTTVGEAFKNAEEKKKNLDKVVQEAESRSPAKVQQALNSGTAVVTELKSLHSEKESLTSKADDHLQRVQPLAGQLFALYNQVAEVERFGAYISWINRVEDVSGEIEQLLDSGLLGSAVEQFSVITEVVHLLTESSCDNLIKFAVDMQTHWYKVLTSRLASEFDDIVKALQWPFTALSTAPPLSTNSDVYCRMERMFLLLLKLQQHKQESADEREILLPLDWLLKPLRKRFRFHFYGNKQTNNLEKPEWYFTQVLNWIKSHGDFLNHTIQPILDKANFGFIDARVEFLRGLLIVVVEKMESSVPALIEDNILYSHFIDETLLFDKEIHYLYDYPSDDHSCLMVLTRPECLQKWLQLEQKYAKENVESVFSSPTAWKPKYQDVGNVDDTKTPECAEQFMILLTVITERCGNLAERSHQFQFLELQLELLHDFIARLNFEAEEQSWVPVDQHFCSVLNSACYVTLILQEWSEQAHFLELCKHQRRNASQKPDTDKSAAKHGSRPDSYSDAGPLDSVFDEVDSGLQEVTSHMISKIVDHVLQGFIVKSKAYKKERWHNLPPQKAVVCLVLSSSACDMLSYLKDQLQSLRRLLALSIFTSMWKSLAHKLDQFIFEQIILSTHFNDGGAAQLQFDMTNNLFTLFGEYTQKPENYFKQVKESCILLTLLPGSAVLLREVLKSDEEDTTHQAALSDIRVYRLTPQVALNVLNLRIN